MNKITEIKNLVDELNAACDAYYNGKEILMTDYEFDVKLKYLSELEKELNIVLSNSPTVNVGAPVLTKLEKVKHEYKNMLSLNKCHSAKEIVEFAHGKELVAMVKMDGLSCRLTYENGKLVKAETRGDGEIGSLITEHAKQFTNIPYIINKSGVYVIDGEAIITDKDFEEINKNLPKGVEKFKNSRNLASGTLALLDMSIVKERKITFIAWDVIVGSDEETIVKKLDEASNLGFEHVPYIYNLIQNAVVLNEEEINQINDWILNKAKKCGYLCDGVVWKFNDVSYGDSLGNTSHHFNAGIAWKPGIVEYETELIDIEWSCSKNSINPVAIFKPTIVNGNTIERASCHNINYIENLELGIGDKITVYLANEIIPQINQNLTRSGNYVIPDICPCCESKTEIHNENGSKTLHCSNPNCKAKFVSKLEHACSKYALNIDGMSGATAELLVDLGYVKSIDDLYHLETHKDTLMKVKGLGKKSVEKLLSNIEKSRNITMENFLVALCIPNVGRTASKALSKYYNGDITSFIFNASSEIYFDFTVIPDFGEITSKAINKFFAENIQEVSYLYEEMNFIVETEQKSVSGTNIDLQGATFCITGKLQHYSNRDVLVADIEAYGGKYVSGVTSKTNYLINNDVTSTSGKNAKAKQVGCAIISESEFMKMVGK